jgi:hypothetical protein
MQDSSCNADPQAPSQMVLLAPAMSIIAFLGTLSIITNVLLLVKHHRVVGKVTSVSIVLCNLCVGFGAVGFAYTSGSNHLDLPDAAWCREDFTKFVALANAIVVLGNCAHALAISCYREDLGHGACYAFLISLIQIPAVCAILGHSYRVFLSDPCQAIPAILPPILWSVACALVITVRVYVYYAPRSQNAQNEAHCPSPNPNPKHPKFIDWIFNSKEEDLVRLMRHYPLPDPKFVTTKTKEHHFEVETQPNPEFIQTKSFKTNPHLEPDHLSSRLRVVSITCVLMMVFLLVQACVTEFKMPGCRWHECSYIVCLIHSSLAPLFIYLEGM